MNFFKYQAAVAVTMLSLIAACKIQDVKPATTGNAPQLIKIEQDAANYTSYQYNADGLLTGATSMHNQAATAVATTYNASKQAASVTMGDEIYTPVYTDGRLTRLNVSQQQKPQALTAYFTYSYTNDKVTTADYYVITDGQNAQLAARARSTYNAAGDMVTQQLLYAVGANMQVSTTTQYEYDDKINPLAKSFNLTDVLLASPATHNITKRTVYDGAGNLTETNTYTFAYGSNNYPQQVTCKVAKPGNTDVSTVSKFIYQ